MEQKNEMCPTSEEDFTKYLTGALEAIRNNEEIGVNGDSRGRAYAELCEKVCGDEYRRFRPISVDCLLREFHGVNCKNASPFQDGEKLALRSYLGILIDGLQEEDFEEFCVGLVGMDFCYEIFQLLEHEEITNISRRGRLFLVLEERKARILRGKIDIYRDGEIYRYGTGTMVMKDKDYIPYVYENMEDKDCLVLAVADLISPVMRLDGYGYRIKDEDFNNLESYKLLDKLEDCMDSKLTRLIWGAIISQREKKGDYPVSQSEENFRILANDFFRDKERKKAAERMRSPLEER